MSESKDTVFPPDTGSTGASSDWIVGVIDDPAAAEEAQRSLLSAGFAQDDVLLLHGPEALRRMEARDEQRGPLGWLSKAVAKVVTDAGTFEANYTREASAGHSIINIHTNHPDYIARAKTVLDRYGAHFVKQYGPWTVSDLS